MPPRSKIPAPPASSALEDRAVAAASQIERDIRRFLHELAGLVDGTRRAVELGRLHLDADGARGLEPAIASLQTAQAGLDQLAELVISARAGSTDVPAMPGMGASLRENVWDAVELVRPAASASGIDLAVDIDAQLTRYRPIPIFPVVRNALRNAVEASNGGGSVRPVIGIRARIESGVLVLTITDEGAGLSVELADRSPFHEGLTTKPEGMGIGLALCQEIVDALDGQVTLTNRQDGTAGCVFALHVPVTEVGSAEVSRGAREG
ncbi:MAG: sensor histidine kinase [Planctomycetota bacterium]